MRSCWSVLGEAGTVQRETAQERILTCLRAQKEPISAAEVAASLSLNRWTVKSALYRLKGDGIIEPVGRGGWQVCHG